MSDIKPPNDSLLSYFDELLGDDIAADLSTDDVGQTNARLSDNLIIPREGNIHKVANASRVLVLPQASTGTSSTRASSAPVGLPPTEPKKLNLVTSQVQKQSESLPAFVEPEHAQSLEQKQKLERMLQSARTQLLVETTAKVESKVNVEPKVDIALEPLVDVKSTIITEEIQDWDIESLSVDTPIEVPDLVVEAEEVHASANEIGRSSFQIDGLEWLENGRPVWAQNRFDVLLFNVAGLTLAVPLIALGQIQPLTDELTPLFGQADWFMGLQPTLAGKIRTVNTAKFVMPERYDEGFVKSAKYVVSIDGVPWGLAVNSVNQPITLEPEDVKWRTDRSKRPWLAGTVKEHMCALLDIPRFGQMLMEADKNFKPH